MLALAACLFASPIQIPAMEEIMIKHRKAKDTISPVELNHGDAVHFETVDGSVLELRLLSTSANILFTNRDKIPEDESGNDRGNMYRARLLYEFTAKILVNDQPMEMRRYVGSQESLYEPYVINGVRIWFDGVNDIFEEHGGFLNTARRQHGMPHKHARFVLQDMTLRVCPDEVHAYFKDGDDRDPNYIYRDYFIDVGRTFSGDNVFLGAYLGGESHGALDINMPMDSLIYVPIDLDSQDGIRMNGIRQWADGSVWRLGIGHIMETFLPDHTPARAGTVFGRGARRATWWHPHSHFSLAVTENDRTYDIDPWILFWQHFEDEKRKDNVMRAIMRPLRHTRTGVPVEFSGSGSAMGPGEGHVSWHWTFGDGGASDEASPVHTFAQAGVYPVTLTLEKGSGRVAFTQHITVEGDRLTTPSLTITAADEPAFRKRPPDALDTYSVPVTMKPHTLEFTARATRPVPDARTLQLVNTGGGSLAGATHGIEYREVTGWVNVAITGEGDEQEVSVGVDATGLAPGVYNADVAIHVQDARNSPQRFRVVLNVPKDPIKTFSVLIDNSDPECYVTPYFWIGHRFHGWGWPELREAEGYNNFYLINGERARKGEFARYTPDLQAGNYTLWLHERTPFASGPPANNTPARFQVRVKHADGEDWVWMEPEATQGFNPRPYPGEQGWNWMERQPTRVIGSFRFNEGTDGFIEIHAGGSTGQVLVDAIRLLRFE